jgi:hypothetical protein
MAVGSLTGPALGNDPNPFVPLSNPNPFDPSGMINPNQTLSSAYPTGQGQGQTWDLNLNMTPGSTAAAINTGGMDWSQAQSQPQTLNQMQFGSLGADNGLAFGATGVMVGPGEAGGENSDEYWNALIDGESPRSQE